MILLLYRNPVSQAQFLFLCIRVNPWPFIMDTTLAMENKRIQLTCGTASALTIRHPPFQIALPVEVVRCC